MAVQPDPATRARQSLHEFVQQAWHVIEPDTEFRDGWHIRVVCEHLEELVFGSLFKNVVINIPPGCMKSILASVCLCPWAWLTNPSMRFMFASYSQPLALRDSVKARHIVRSDWYRQTARQLSVDVQLAGGQDQKSRFDTTAAGWRFSTSVGGSATGEHPDVIIVDDAHSAAQAESDKERQGAVDWWFGTMSTRGRSRDVRRGVIGQRLHESDLPGSLIETGSWTHLMLPMEFEPDRQCVTPLGVVDPRTEAGELLCPDLFGRESVDGLKIEMGSLRSAGQLQQRPTAAGGEIFRREWFTLLRALPVGCRAVRYWDKAGSDSSGDWTVGCLLAERDGVWYVVDVIRGQWSYGRREQIILQTAQEDDARNFSSYAVWVEQEPGSGGKESAQRTIKMLAGFSAHADRPVGRKEKRWEPWAAQLEAGNVHLIQAPWNAAFRDEHLAAPAGEHDDQIDAASAAFAILANRGGGNLQAWLDAGAF